MLRDHTRALRRFACLTLIALALVPLLARGHVHRDADAASSACAACFAAHHSAVKPAAPAVVLAAPAPRPAPATELARPANVARRTTQGVRAPPLPTHLV